MGKFKDEKLIENFLRQNLAHGLVEKEELAAIVNLVAGIPWGEGRTVEEVLETKKVGTCTGKHLVLQACLDKLRIEYRPVVCTFRWGKQEIDYPKELQAILDKGEWDHGHNFVQIKNGSGYIDIDITWDPPLAPYGFRTFPENWDGESSFIGVKFIQRWDDVDPVTKKEELLDLLSPELRKRRAKFLKKLIG